MTKSGMIGVCPTRPRTPSVPKYFLTIALPHPVRKAVIVLNVLKNGFRKRERRSFRSGPGKVPERRPRIADLPPETVLEEIGQRPDSRRRKWTGPLCFGHNGRPIRTAPAQEMSDYSIEISEHAGVRYLHFSAEWIQGAMRVKRPNALELAYTREMMAGLLLREVPWPRNALLIGLGAGSLVKFIYHKLPWTKTTVVEVDPRVEIVARLHFDLPDDPFRLRVAIGDGARFMLQGGESYDYILVDGFDEKGKAGALDTESFYQACRARLTSEGLLAVNLLGRSRGFTASKDRIAAAFDDRTLVFPSCDSGNAIAFARGHDPVDIAFEELLQRAETIHRHAGLDLTPTVHRIQREACLTGNRLLF
jgi:spermidine synthase